jgi:alanyl-tRNA synthetase
VGPLAAEMGEAFPELVKAQPMVERVLRQEEERFAETLEKGLRILEEDIAGLSGTEIPGRTIFVLYDTYGFPVDLTGDIARERGLTLDMAGFEAEMEAQRERARAASHFEADYRGKLNIEGESSFTGYDHLDGTGCVIALFRGGEPVEALESGDHGLVVLDETPFYAESGGQVGDTGELLADGVLFEVTDTRKHGAAHAHVGRVVQGRIGKGDRLGAKVDQARRQAVVLNHSATHLMHAALREILGDHVQQKGSLVAPDRLRFDFSHFQPVTAEELECIERRVNEAIRANAETEARVMPLQEALDAGAMALFGEKYGDQVRVLSMGGFSTELCGGTHVRRTGDIGLFKIVSESGVASGIRRIEAVTGENALNYIGETEKNLYRVAERVKAGRGDLDEKVGQLVERTRQLERELESLKGKLASQAGSSLADQAVDVAGIKVLAAQLEGADPKSLRDTVDQLKNKLGEAAVVLGTVSDGKVSLVAGVTAGQTSRIKAGELVNAVARQVGGKGGGRPDMAMAGGTDPAALPGALATVPEWVRERLAD